MEVAVRHHSRFLLLANASTLTGPHCRPLQQIFTVRDHAGGAPQMRCGPRSNPTAS